MADAPDTERQAVEPDAREILSVSQLEDAKLPRSNDSTSRSHS